MPSLVSTSLDGDRTMASPGMVASSATEPVAIRDLERSGALTAHQATLLLEAWPNLAEDWASHPFFSTIREHTHAYIDRLACDATGVPR